mgnify:FL=1
MLEVSIIEVINLILVSVILGMVVGSGISFKK